MGIKIRYTLAFIVIVGILFAIFSDHQVRDRLSQVTGKIVNQVEDIYPNRSCEEPINYSLGEIDARFGITEDKIISLLQEAENVWEDSIDRNLFQYSSDKENSVLVNFIFDERQQQIIEARSSEASLEDQWESLDVFIQNYNTVSDKYKADADVYDADVADYEALLTEFNDTVAEWNEEGGSNSEYRQLKQQEYFIETVYKGLEAKKDELNETADSLNNLAEQINILQDGLSRKTDLHNAKYANDDVIHSGDFSSYTINVYQYYSISDLRLILAHELGHALGIDHVDDPESIMHYLLETQNLHDLSATVDDLAALDSVCSL